MQYKYAKVINYNELNKWVHADRKVCPQYESEFLKLTKGEIRISPVKKPVKSYASAAKG